MWISFFDRELSFSYDAKSQSFVGEDRGYSWYDGETYAESYDWPTAAECVDAMVRLERPPPRLDLTVYPYLPQAHVATTSAKAYMDLLTGVAS